MYAVRASVAVLALWARVAGAQGDSPRAPVAAVADTTWRWQRLDGSVVTPATFRGSVVLVNMWATWCEPCVAELRSLGALRSAVADSTLVFALVAPQQRVPVAAFVARRRVTLPVYLEASPAPAMYGLSAVPTTWILDHTGRVVFTHRGARRWDVPEVIALLDSLVRVARETPPSGVTPPR
jgi:thiol-disulfide isomerase/thioredoxin